jgi:hypothetical protein
MRPVGKEPGRKKEKKALLHSRSWFVYQCRVLYYVYYVYYVKVATNRTACRLASRPAIVRFFIHSFIHWQTLHAAKIQ